jgi:hypothetical protein
MIALTLLALSAAISRFLTPRPAVMAPLRQTQSAASTPQIAAQATSIKPSPGKTQEASDELAALQKSRHNEYVRQRINELGQLAMNQDETSRATILSELTNADQEICHAALEALIQTKDQSAIPQLEAIAGLTEDPQEKAAMLEAVQFIKLPSLTDYLAEHPQDSNSGVPLAKHSHGWIGSKSHENTKP